MLFADLLTISMASAKYTDFASSLLWGGKHKSLLICVSDEMQYSMFVLYFLRHSQHRLKTP
jgi:hypothetical protein